MQNTIRSLWIIFFLVKSTTFVVIEKGDLMYRVYEVFKADGKGFMRYENRSKKECESWIKRHELREPAVINGLSELIITEKGVRI